MEKRINIDAFKLTLEIKNIFEKYNLGNDDFSSFTKEQIDKIIDKCDLIFKEEEEYLENSFEVCIKELDNVNESLVKEKVKYIFISKYKYIDSSFINEMFDKFINSFFEKYNITEFNPKMEIKNTIDLITSDTILQFEKSINEIREYYENKF